LTQRLVKTTQHFLECKVPPRLFLCTQIVYPILPMSVMHLVSKYGHYEGTVTGGPCGKLMATEKGKKDRTAAPVTTRFRLQALGGFRCSTVCTLHLFFCQFDSAVIICLSLVYIILLGPTHTVNEIF